MITDRLRTQLEELNRRLPPGSRRPQARRRPDAEPLPLPEGEELTNGSGTHYVIRSPVAKLWPQGGRLVEHHWLLVSSLDEDPETTHPEVAAFARHFPGRALFLDLETCGFAGSAVFLVGVLYEEPGGELVLEQLLARNYAEERAMLETLWQRAAGPEVLVSFNGKSFDWPMLRDRSVYHRLHRPRRTHLDPPRRREDAPPLVHFDLLHHARRRWRKALPDCKLTTLERYLCRRRRRGDIPGSEIPQAYHGYVRSGDARQVREILHHNALDLITLAELSLRLFS